MSDEEPVCAKPQIEEDCKPHCTKYKKEYDACVERVREKGDGHCTGQYFDFWHCVDHCAKDKIFTKIK